MPNDVRKRRQADLRFLLSLGINITQKKEIMSLSSTTLGQWQVSYDFHDAVLKVIRWDNNKISLRRDLLLSTNQGQILLGELEELEEYILKHIFQFIAEEVDALSYLEEETNS